MTKQNWKKEIKVAFDTELLTVVNHAAKNNFQSRNEFIRRACIEKIANAKQEVVTRCAI